MEKHVKLFIFAGGIFVCYFYYGILQERITRGVYGEEKEKFTCILALVFVQCIVNCLYANILLRTIMKQGENTTLTFYYWSSALTYLLAMVCSNMALQWVNYPTQVIGKSGKPIPVMILGVLLGKKKYPIQKYFFVFLVVIGVALFMYKDGKSSGNDSGPVIGIGEMLLLLSLTMDGVTGAIQERMRAEYKTKSLHMMSSVNKWSVAFLGIAIAYTGEIIDFIKFVQRHPSIAWQLLSFSVASAQGQMFIFLTVEHFGPLPCSIVTTTRKFFTVFGSIIFFGNSLSSKQWIATVVVFTGLLLDAVYGKNKPKDKNQQSPSTKTVGPWLITNVRISATPLEATVEKEERKMVSRGAAETIRQEDVSNRPWTDSLEHNSFNNVASSCDNLRILKIFNGQLCVPPFLTH